jgi:hypothetical protein
MDGPKVEYSALGPLGFQMQPAFEAQPAQLQLPEVLHGVGQAEGDLIWVGHKAQTADFVVGRKQEARASRLEAEPRARARASQVGACRQLQALQTGDDLHNFEASNSIRQRLLQ